MPMIITKEKTGHSVSLYQLTSELIDILPNLIVDNETGEIMYANSETGELVPASDVAELKELTADKICNIARFVGSQEALASEIDEHIKSCRARLDTLKNSIAANKNLAISGMKALQIKKIEAADIRISTRKSESVNVFDEAQIPEKFMKEKITKTVDKTSIKAAIKAGEEVAGASVVENVSLVIK